MKFISISSFVMLSIICACLAPGCFAGNDEKEAKDIVTRICQKPDNVGRIVCGGINVPYCAVCGQA
jgi:hypothetical protein